MWQQMVGWNEPKNTNLVSQWGKYISNIESMAEYKIIQSNTVNKNVLPILEQSVIAYKAVKSNYRIHQNQVKIKYEFTKSNEKNQLNHQY